MTDADIRLNLLPPRLPKFAIAPALILAAGCVVFFPLAAIDTILTTHESGYAENSGVNLGMVISTLCLAALISFAVVLGANFRLTEDRPTRGFVSCIGFAILCSGLLITVYSAGTWVPYLLHWDGLSVQDRVEGSELEVEGIILVQAFLGGVASVFVGCVAGILAWTYQFAPKLREIAARPPWPWRIGLSAPLLLGLALAFGALISWLGDGYEPPEELVAGRVEGFAVGVPRLFEEEDIWLVRLTEGSVVKQAEFVALYDRGLESGCPLQWRRDHEFSGRRGWFVDACNGAAYDLNGLCASDPCRGIRLDRFFVNVWGDNVVVDLSDSFQDPSAGKTIGPTLPADSPLPTPAP